MRIAMVGRGRMAMAIVRLVEERGHTIALTIGAAENRGATAITADRMSGVDLAFEFTRPDAAADNLRALARLGMPTVCGTTGWQDALPSITALVQQHRSALLYAPNFSVGVQLYLRAARQVASIFAGQPLDAHITESHHAAKRDAPSGTALALAASLSQGDPAREFPITSVRGGHDPGTHRVTYDAPFETIRFEHVSRGREAFAAGAVAAAEWLPGRTGVFTFAQMLFGESQS
jgi:4-hydroxy-tetrahydrodipicolinate reductase